MSFVVKAKETKNGHLFNFKFFLCKKRTPKIGYVYSYFGFNNNYKMISSKRLLFLNLNKSLNISRKGYKMNSRAYNNIGIYL